MPRTQQLYLDHVFPKGIQNIRLDQWAKMKGFTFKFAWKLWDEGVLFGNNNHGSKQGFQALKKSKAERKDLNLNFRYTQTITREAALFYEIVTANYDDELKLQRMIECLDAFSPEDRIKIASAARQKATQPR